MIHVNGVVCRVWIKFFNLVLPQNFGKVDDKVIRDNNKSNRQKILRIKEIRNTLFKRELSFDLSF